MENKEIDEEVKRIGEETHKAETEDYEKICKEGLIISLVGTVNAGKSKTINALTGKNFAEAKATAGHTKDIKKWELQKGVFIADTPGLHDINEEVSQKAYNFVDKDADIVLFFLNAAVGLSKTEKEGYLSIKELDKEMIVVLNKIDTLDEEGIKDTIEQIEKELNIKPVAISAQKNIGIENLHRKISSVLKAKGKDILFAKVSKFKDEEVDKWIKRAAVSAAGIGAIPVPGADIIPLTALQVALGMKIAHVHGINPSKDDIVKLVGATLTGQVGKQFFKWGIQALKATGWIPGGQLLLVASAALGATIASSLTYGFGHACNAYYKSGMTIEMGEFGDIIDKISTEYKKDKV